MKLNSESAKSTECKEDVLMCIFKDVPNFTLDDADERNEPSWSSGSHLDIMLGRQGTPSFNSSSGILAQEETPVSAPLATDSSSLPGRSDESSAQSARRKVKKTKKQAQDGESKTEVEIWSSKYPSEEQFSTIPKASKKIARLVELSHGHKLVVRTTFRLNSETDVGTMDDFTNPEDLCEECRWIVRAAKSMENLMSSEDEEENEKRFLSRAKESISARNSLETSNSQNYDEKQVMALLDEARASLLENSILLATHKLWRKVRKDGEEAGVVEVREGDVPSVEDLEDLLLDQDQTQTEEGPRPETSRLALALGRLVTKYLRVS